MPQPSLLTIPARRCLRRERQFRDGRSERESELSSRLEAWQNACSSVEGERNMLMHQLSLAMADKVHLEQQVRWRWLDSDPCFSFIDK